VNARQLHQALLGQPSLAAPLPGCHRWRPTDQRRELGLRLQPI
jgi:hypothetical protein